MTEKNIYEKLEKSCSPGYRINELVEFYYPVRKITMKVLVNKQPDASLVKIYSVILSAIDKGFDSNQKLFDFLGLSKDDEFMERELYALREKKYIDIISEKWFVTQAGKEFINDNRIMRIETEEDFEFYIDGLSGNVIHPENPEDFDKSAVVRKLSDGKKALETTINFHVKSPDLLDDKFSQIANFFKSEKPDEALISYDSNDIKNDYENWIPYWLIEYIPERNGTNTQEAALEIRSFKEQKKIKSLTTKFNGEYQHYIYKLTNSSDRIAFKELTECEPLIANKFKISQSAYVPANKSDFEVLSIWETKTRFIEALKNVKEKILIESPWIKQATQEYIPYFEKLLKENKKLVILYGIEGMDEHDINTLKGLESLQKKYNTLFFLIHLPTHFKSTGLNLTGTHRKLLIKDNEFYISGSFNFLSFGKQKNQKVANEESHIIRRNVKERWDHVCKEYEIKIIF